MNVSQATKEQNPYPDSTPEQQLWSQMKTYEMSARSFQADAEALIKKADDARQRAEAFAMALERLRSK